MIITFERDNGVFEMGGIEYLVTCIVRNEKNGWRNKNEIVTTVPEDGERAFPYQPRPFPLGVWDITEVLETENPEYAPYFIRTNAFQMLPAWFVVINPVTGRKEYLKPSTKMVKDVGYGFHHAMYHNGINWVDSNTTLGCGNIKIKDNALYIGSKIQHELKKDRKVEVRVV